MRRVPISLVIVLACRTRTLAAQQPTGATAFHQEYAELVANTRRASDSARLHQLVTIDWRYQMAEFPEYATFVGYSGQNARWRDNSVQAIERRKRELQDPLAVIRSIDRARLSPADRLNYDLFRRGVEEQLDATRFPEEYLAITQLGGVQQDVEQILGLMPTSTVKDYEDVVARLNGVPALVEQTLALLAKGMDAGVTPPRITLRDVPDQIKRLAPDDPLASPLLRRFSQFSASIPVDERERLRGAAIESYTRRVAPAYRKLYDYVVGTYLPGTRESLGMNALPDGTAWYAFKVRQFTTTSLTPDQIHNLGLREVKRIRAEMDHVIASVGFKGSFSDFTQFLRTDPQFFYPDSATVVRAYRDIAKRIDPRLIELFGTLPRLPYGVTTVPSYAAKSQTGAYYWPGSPQAGRPGWFFVNTYDLKEHPKWSMETLTLHEAVPGHHLQMALAEELENLPDFRRYGGYTAYVEGWGLYAEGLGSELGLYEDPYSKFGQLNYEIWRAIRLVLDTGIHALGWTRQQAIDYFKENSAQADHEVVVEVDRYIVNPGQALAYKLGQLKFNELRTFAATELGPRFSIRTFHDEVLRNGALPLDVLDAHVRAWVAAQK